LVVSSLVGASSETLKVSSTGDAAKKQGSKMGDYVSTSKTKHGHPVYEKTEGIKNFLYVSSLGVWSVGRKVGSSTSGLYNPELPAPSTPPTSGWLYSDLPNGWKNDATLKVEKKSASSAGTQRTAAATAAATAADVSVAATATGVSVVTRNGITVTISGQQAPASRTAEVVSSTRDTKTADTRTADIKKADAPTAPAAAPCATRIQVQIGDGDGAVNTASSIDQASNNFGGYRGVYTLQAGPDRFGNAVYTMTTPAIAPATVGVTRTIRRVRVEGGEEWQMTGGSAITAVGRTWATATNPHLVNDAVDACPPMTGWRYQIGPNGYIPDSKVIVRPFP